MTIVFLTLFALLVAGRPILPDSDFCDPASAPSAPQTALQATFQIHLNTGKDDDPKLEVPRFQPQAPKQRVGCFSLLDADNIATAASFGLLPGVIPSVQDGQHAFDIDDDSRLDPSVTSDSVVQQPPASASIVVLAFFCATAILALACIALTLYIIKSLRSQMFASKTAWDLLPHFWRRRNPQGEASTESTKHVLGRSRPLLSDRLPDAEEGTADRHGLHMEGKHLFLDAVSDVESDCDDVDEKYQDAVDMTPLSLIHDLPLEENVPPPSHFDTPASPFTGTCPFDQLKGDRSISLMRDLCSPSVSRPAWSVRVIDSPALGLSSREGDGIASTPQPLITPRRRAYRSGFPEFDIALAMQLRPGLGIGADSAWMVRFLMTIFGWFAVALTGRTR